MSAAVIAALIAGLFIGICIGIAVGIFLVLGTLSLQALEEREGEGYPPPAPLKAQPIDDRTGPDSVWREHGL